jgi:phage terminase large subunit-like protein
LRAKLLQLPDPERRAALAALRPETALALLHDWRFRARDAQLAPEGPWRTWMVMAGRGFGKTRCGAEWILERVEAGARRIHLVGATAADVRDTMIEGESGILNVAPPRLRPVYIHSKRLLRWPQTGARALCFSSEKPRQLRGPQCDTAWADETAAWEKPDTWDQLLFGLRLGTDPRVCVTTTPRPTKLIKKILREPTTAVTRGSTYENAANLATGFLDDILRQFEGTRLGRQELEAELLEDTPGALWRLGQIEADRVDEAPELARIAVAVDPSATNTETSAETGIVAGGVDARGHGYILRDASGKYTPGEWGAAAVLLHDALDADCIVVETNQGGDMAVHVLTTAAEKLFREKKRKTPHITVRRVHASRGKRARAEAPAALSEQHRVHHVGCHAKLEDQLCTWDASDGSPSPDRLDAFVWLVTHLMLETAAAPSYDDAAAALGAVQRRDTARASAWDDPEDDD